MTKRRVVCATTIALVVAAALVAAPRLARTEVPEGHHRLGHLPAGLVAAQLRHARETNDRTYNDGWLRVVPDEFVGRRDECGPGYPAGSNIVQAAWLRGLGLPDDGQANSNPVDPRDNPGKRNPRAGLLLSKNGPTPDCSAAGAQIVGTPPRFTITELGFDYRIGTHCGNGAPRFNIVTPDGVVYFAGCANGTKSPAPQDPAQWTRVRFASEQIFAALTTSPPFQLGVTEVAMLVINHDEGTDIALTEAPGGVGLVVLDNIDINGHLITDSRTGRN